MKNEPTVMRPARISLAPVYITPAPTSPRRTVEESERAEVVARVRNTLSRMRRTPPSKTAASRPSAWYPFTTRTPPSDSVRRPVTSAYICPRSRNTGRSTRNPRKTTRPKTASATRVRRVTRGLIRSITVKASDGGEQAPGQLDEAGPHQVPEALHVVHDPGDEVARLVRVVERDRQAAHVLLDPDAHVGDQLLRRLRDELHQREGAEALHDGGGHDGPDQGQQQARSGGGR